MSAANPQLAPAPDLRFRDYLLQNVYCRTTSGQRSEVIAFWRDEEALNNTAEAERRSHEAVFLVRTSSGELAGLSTVGFMRLRDGRTFYAYRMFLRKQDRVPYLMLAVVLATRDFLKAFPHPDMQPTGILHVNENPKLRRPGMRRLFEREGYRFWGTTPQGEDVWAVEFDSPNAPGHGSRWRERLRKFVPVWSRHRNSMPSLELV
jgi:hypothetical protein